MVPNQPRALRGQVVQLFGVSATLGVAALIKGTVALGGAVRYIRYKRYIIVLIISFVALVALVALTGAGAGR